MLFRRTAIDCSARLRDLQLGTCRLALGTAGLGGIWGPVDEGESIATILYGLEQGIDVLDTAPCYQQAECYVGKALRQWRGKRPIVSTKVGRFADSHDYSPAAIRQSVKRSLDIVGLDCIDLLFVHEPEFVPAAQRTALID